MINLLPPKQRKKLQDEKLFRLILLLGGIVGVALVSLSIFLLVIQITLTKERLSQAVKLVSFEERTAKENSTLGEIRSWNLKLANIEAFKKKRRVFKDIIDEVTVSLPDELYLLSLSYTPLLETVKKGGEVVKTPAIVAVTGKAQTREELLSFKDALQANPFFTEVVFPPSNWVNPTDITFSFQAKLKNLP